MLSTQTKELLTSLTNSQLRRLGDFLNSPYFVTRDAIPKMYKIIYGAYPDFDSPALESKNIFKKLFPGKKYSEQTIKNLYSDFGNFLKKFIGYEEIRRDDKNIDQYIVSGITNLACFEISNKTIEKILTKDNGLLNAAIDFHHFKSLYSMLYVNYGNLNIQNTPDANRATNNLSETVIIHFLRELFFIKTEEIVSHTNPQNRAKYLMLETILSLIDIKKFLKILKKEKHEYADYLKIHYLFYHYAVNNITEKQYKDLKILILGTIRKVSGLEKIHFISRFCQLTHLKLIPKDTKYFKDHFDMAKLFCELKIYPDKTLPDLFRGVFIDFFTVAMFLREFDWAEKFVDEYGRYLDKEERDDIVNIRKGILFFKKRNYELSLEYLSKIKIHIVLENLNIRFYYLMNYIELKAYESALSALNSIRQFYSNSREIPELVLGLIPDSLKYFKEIIRCEEKKEKIDGLIYAEAHGNKRYYHKQYILEKMEQINT